MRVLVTGRDGQLGRWLVRLLEADPGSELVAAVDVDEIDFCEPAALSALVDRYAAGGIDVLINAAAFTAVDLCESEEATALQVNGDAPGLLARKCAEHGVVMVHVSTDFVFDGAADRPYTEEDAPAPASAYGRTKLAGERAVLAAGGENLLVRTSWVFGPGKNFVRTMVEQAERRVSGEVEAPLRVVDDQRGRPTYSADLARGILDLLQAGARGLVHLSNSGEASWWELARASLDAAGYSQVGLERIPAKSYPRPAATPMYSVLDLSRARDLGVELRPWAEAVADYLNSSDSPVTKVAA